MNEKLDERRRPRTRPAGGRAALLRTVSGPVLASAWTFLLLPSLARAAQGTPPAALPDLDVVSLSLLPRYPAYSVRIVQGAPELFDPEGGGSLTAEQAAPVQRAPKRGDTVTATARVVNRGTVPTGPFLYTWFLNGKKAGSGRHSGLAADCLALPESSGWVLRGRTYRTAPLRPGTYVDLPYPFRWRSGRNRLELRVTPETKKQEELTTGNNSRSESLDGLAFAVLVRRSTYNSMAHLRNADGTFGFEDWIQRYFDLLRGKLENSVYPEVPAGAMQPVRVDTIVVLDDQEEARDFDSIQARNGWDGHWEYGRTRNPSSDAPGTDWTILRELGRQLGLLDLDRLDVPPENNPLREPGSDERVSLGFVLPEGGMMQRPGDVPFAEASVVALNRMHGARRGYSGVQLYDLPQTCRLRILDNNARPVAKAEVSVYQTEDGRLSPRAIATGTTSDDGTFELPNRPAPAVHTTVGMDQHPNPFGKIDLTGRNGVLLLRVTARGATDYQWLPITAFNIAAGTGHRGIAVQDLRTALPAVQAPHAPENLSAQVDQEGDLRAVFLNWKAPESPQVVAYFVYRALYPQFGWERIGAVSRPGYVDVLIESVPGYQVRYAVTAVDLQGNESALQHTPVLFVPDL